MSKSSAKQIKAGTTPTVVPFPHRQWSAAKVTAINSDWPIYQRPIDVDVRHAITTIRARARELAQNADHARGFLRIARNNLVGKPGFVLQSRAQTARGTPDDRLRAAIESAWLAWGERGSCEVSGKFNWRQLQRHVAETVVRDGEAFLRVIVGADNPSAFALQVIDPAAVDESYNGTWQGRDVRMGVELDDFRKPIAFHLYGESPITAGTYRTGTDRFRVPAEEIIHVYLPEFCWQTRGVSWLAVGAGRMHMITGTEDAEVTASRASAAKFAAYEAKEWAPAPEPRQDGLVDVYGRPLMNDPGSFAQDIAPGTTEVVPYGYELRLLDPQHPNSRMPDFLKWALRSVSTGWGCSYNTLGNDAEGVNYTSLRFFLGVERDNWMELQDWLQDDLIERVYGRWAETQLRLGTLPVRPGRERELYRNHWQARRWDGPDPKKQADADEKELSIGSTTLHEICARKGRDFDDLIDERVRELSAIKALAEAAGLTLQDVLPLLAKSATAPTQETLDADDDDD
jgi:lambda family phage portal protein